MSKNHPTSSSSSPNPKHNPMLTLKILITGAVLAVALGDAAVLGLMAAYPMKWMWNWMMPDLFGVPEIEFWHAFLLFAMSHLLFQRTTLATCKAKDIKALSGDDPDA